VSVPSLIQDLVFCRLVAVLVLAVIWLVRSSTQLLLVCMGEWAAAELLLPDRGLSGGCVLVCVVWAGASWDSTTVCSIAAWFLPVCSCGLIGVHGDVLASNRDSMTAFRGATCMLGRVVCYIEWG